MSRTERKPIEEAEFTVVIDLQAANAPAVKAEQELAEIKSAFGDEQRNITLAIGQRLGRKSILNIFSKFSNVTDLLDIQKIKESKKYKGYTYIDEMETRNALRLLLNIAFISRDALLNLISKSVGIKPDKVTRYLANLSKLGVVQETKVADRWRLGPAFVQIALAHQAHMQRVETELEEVKQRYSRKD